MTRLLSSTKSVLRQRPRTTLVRPGRAAGSLRAPGLAYNWATWSATDKSANIVLSNGGLTSAVSSSGSWQTARATRGLNTGKHYFEILVTNTGGGDGPTVGLCTASSPLSTYNPTNSGTVRADLGWLVSNGSFAHQNVGIGGTHGSLVRFAVDCLAGKAWISAADSDTWFNSGDPVAGTNPQLLFTPGTQVFPFVGHYENDSTAVANFGQSTFVRSVPEGFTSGWGVPAPTGDTDPFFSSVSLLMLFDGPNGGTVYTDSSPSPVALTRDGTSQISTAQAFLGGSSLSCVNGGVLVDSADTYDFASGNFAMELYWRRSGTGGGHFFDAWASRFLFRYSNGELQFYTSFSAPLMNASVAIPQNEWSHLAVGRQGNNFGMWFNGQSVATASSPSAISSAVQNLRISPSNGDTLAGFIDCVRVTKAARYTPGQNFVPPTAFPTA